MNAGAIRFRDVTSASGDFGTPVEVSRALVFGDIDEDGDLDLLVTNTAGRVRLYRNDARKEGGWLLVRAFDPERKRDAHGARVQVVAGGKSYLRLASPGYSYLSSNDPRAHFGLPGGVAIERIDVMWPDGSRERFPGGATNRVVVVEKGAGRPGR